MFMDKETNIIELKFLPWKHRKSVLSSSITGHSNDIFFLVFRFCTWTLKYHFLHSWTGGNYCDVMEMFLKFRAFKMFARSRSGDEWVVQQRLNVVSIFVNCATFGGLDNGTMKEGTWWNITLKLFVLFVPQDHFTCSYNISIRCSWAKQILQLQMEGYSIDSWHDSVKCKQYALKQAMRRKLGHWEALHLRFMHFISSSQHGSDFKKTTR